MNNIFFFNSISNTVYFSFAETLKLFCMNDLLEVKDKLKTILEEKIKIFYDADEMKNVENKVEVYFYEEKPIMR